MKRFITMVLSCALFLGVTACMPAAPTLEGGLKFAGPSKMSIVITQDDPLSAAIGGELSDQGLPVIGVKQLNGVLNEKSLQLSGMASMDEEKLLEAGKILHADALVSVEAKKNLDGTIDEALITLVGVKSETVMGSFHYENGRVKEKLKDSAKRIADAISRAVEKK